MFSFVFSKQSKSELLGCCFAREKCARDTGCSDLDTVTLGDGAGSEGGGCSGQWIQLVD